MKHAIITTPRVGQSDWNGAQPSSFNSRIDPRAVTHFQNRKASASEEQREVHRIRYQAYHGAGWIEGNPQGIFSDEFDLLPNSESHLLYRRGSPIGTIRTSVWTGEPGWGQVPSMHVFNLDSVAELRGERFVEMNRFAIRPEFAGSVRTAQLALLNNAVYAADRYGCRYMVAAVRESHVPFYEKLEFKLRLPAAPYFGVTFATVLMVMDWEAARPRLLTHRVFHSVFAFARNDA